MKKLSIKKIWKTITGDRQLLAGTIGLALLLLLAVAAAAVATENPYHYGKDMLVGLGENGHILGDRKSVV